MILDILKAIIIAGIPVALVSYFFTKLTMKKAPVKAKNSKELKIELKNTQVEKDEEDNFFTHMLHKKWMHFGGGFYGVLVFITYIHIEIYQVIDFAKNFTGFQDFINSIGFSMIINFFLEAIMNMVSAFLWFIYWNKYLEIGVFWVWIVVVFIAHTVATKYALNKSR
jgi:hypothetical protein